MIALTLNAESDRTTVAVTPLLDYLNEQTAPENPGGRSACWGSPSCMARWYPEVLGGAQDQTPWEATFHERTRRQIPLSSLSPGF